MTARFALVIANTEYQDASFAKLTAPGRDAEEFAQVLRDLAMFDGVQVLLNEGEGRTRRSIARFFAERKHDDLLLLYFSGHGVRNEQGQLFLAANDTELNILEASGVPSEFITDAMNNSHSQRQLLVLDCCNSGAFAQGTKSVAGVGKSMGIATAFEGRGFGRVVLTATDATQYAWEGDKVFGDTQKSLFTHFLIEGLKGDADLNGDGCIDVDELFDYAYEQVIRLTPKQTPGKWSYKQQGDIVLRDNLSPREVKPAPLPEEVLELLSHPNSGVRRAGIQDLIILMQGKHPGLARAAEEKLREIAEKDDSLTIRRTARDELLARGVVLDKDTTAKFSREHLAASAAQEAAAKETLDQEEYPEQNPQKDKATPPAVAAPDAKGPPSKFSSRLLGWIGGGLLILLILFFGGPAVYSYVSQTPTATPQPTAFPTRTSRPVPTVTIRPLPSVTATKMEPVVILPTVTQAPTETPTPTLGIGSTMVSSKDQMTLVYVPAGKFTMGSESDQEDKNERPVHEVDLGAYWIDQTEVTNAMYAKCVAEPEAEKACDKPRHNYNAAKESYFDKTVYANYPVIFVSWNSAKKYCEWAGRRLPTEAEWEKAARGTDARIYPWGDNLPAKEQLNFLNYPGHTVAVGTYKLDTSLFDVKDLAGNVREWVSSVSYPYPYDSSDGREDESSTRKRIVRGGAWFDLYSNIRSAKRFEHPPSNSYNYIGFRCAMDAPPQSP